MANRIDIGTLRPARELKDGRIRAEAHITRAGVFEYMDSNGKLTKELRDAKDVFDPASLESFEQVPITNNHPTVGALTAENAREHMVGSTGDKIVRDDDHVRASLMVADKTTIADMKRGKVEVSCGYTCDVVDESGVHPVYGAYDRKQTNIRGNHVAIVHRGRAGTSARVRMDDASVMVQDDDVRPTPQRGSPMKVDKKQEHKLDEKAAAKAVSDAELRADKAEESLDSEKKRADAAEGKADALEKEVEQLKESRLDEAEIKSRDAKIDELTKKVTKLTTKLDEANDPKRIDGLVKRRGKIEKFAGAILGEKNVTDAATDRELMCAVVEQCNGVSIDKERSDDYVGARFDAACEGWLAGSSTLERLREIGRRADGEEEVKRDTAVNAHAEYVKKQQNAWKPEKSVR